MWLRKKIFGGDRLEKWGRGSERAPIAERAGHGRGERNYGTRWAPWDRLDQSSQESGMAAEGARVGKRGRVATGTDVVWFSGGKGGRSAARGLDRENFLCGRKSLGPRKMKDWA